MFDPKKLTKHDVEVQIHMVISLIEALRDTGKNNVDIYTLERIVEMGKVQLDSMGGDL